MMPVFSLSFRVLEVSKFPCQPHTSPNFKVRQVSQLRKTLLLCLLIASASHSTKLLLIYKASNNENSDK
ncbi:hypothetical protein MANES_18G136804v8 [Manihot esculenta]|uniref:Uncharacterized protein n=1 Tax=Manihot esculenta TaxID=3983 RepID=A0ACB7G0K9_MANES|nr:hypothetical protein MANES_18G136804v8 [Manihot esculenta]